MDGWNISIGAMRADESNVAHLLRSQEDKWHYRILVSLARFLKIISNNISFHRLLHTDHFRGYPYISHTSLKLTHRNAPGQHDDIFVVSLIGLLTAIYVDDIHTNTDVCVEHELLFPDEIIQDFILTFYRELDEHLAYNRTCLLKCICSSAPIPIT